MPKAWSSPRNILTPKYTLNVNRRDRNGETPFHFAVRKGNIEAIRLLLAHPGVDAKLVDRWNFSPMDLALIHGQSDVFQYLVKNWNMPLPEPDEHGAWGAIHFAVFNNSKSYTRFRTQDEVADNDDLVALIVEELGVDPQLRTAKVRHPDDRWHTHHSSNFLDYQRRNNPDSFSRLDSRDISYCDVSYRASISQLDSCYETVLSLSTQGGNETAIIYFLDRCNIDPNAPCGGCDAATPLHVAAQNLRVNVVGTLISKGKINVNCMDRHKRTPLHLVVSTILRVPSTDYIREGVAIIKELVAAGAQLSATDINGDTPRDLFEARKDIDKRKEERLKRMNLKELLTYE